MKTFPQQRVSYRDKTKNDYEWCKNTIDHLLTHYAPDSTQLSSSSSYHRKLSNYQLYNNILNQKDFERECNPLGLEVGQFKDQIQPYNKTYNKIQVLLGEELRRPFNFKVSLSSPTGIKSKLAHKDELLRNYVYSQIQSSLSSPLTQESPMDPQQIETYMKTSYLESREITATKILEYLRHHLHISDKKNDSFKHALISGEEIVYVSHTHDEPSLKVTNTLSAFYHKSGDTKFIQDSLFAGSQSYFTSAEVLDEFGPYLSKEDIERIDSSQHSSPGYAVPSKSMNYHEDDRQYEKYLRPHDEGSYSPSSSEDWLVQHVEWRSQRRVAFLTFTNEFGETEKKILPEDFPIPPNAKKTILTSNFNKKTTYHIWTTPTSSYALYYDYIPEIWEGTRIGHNIYCKMGPRPYQFRSPDNPFNVKLSYHGVIYSAMNAEAVSPMDRMKPFQYLYFIVMHKLKKLIAQDIGSVFHFDSSMIDPAVGVEKTLYYLRELNIDFYNPLTHGDEPGTHTRAKVTGATDWTNTRSISNYISLLAAIDQQISDVAGVTRQREGQISPNEAVSNANTAVQLSSVITDVYFQTHDRLWEDVLSSLLNMSTELYRESSITKQYFLDDLSLATLQLSPNELTNESFAVFVISSSKEARVYEALQNIAETLASSNKASFSSLIDMYRTNSTEELSILIKAAEEKALQEQRQNQEAQLQSQERMNQLTLDFEREKLDKEIAKDLEVAKINSFRFLQDQDSDNNNIPDQLEIEKFEHQKAMDTSKLELEKQKLMRTSTK
jgi:hypothetical protein